MALATFICGARKRSMIVAGMALTVAFIALFALPIRAHAVGLPSWWNGKTCDTDNYSGSYQLSSGSTYNGVIACGPGPTQGGSDHTETFAKGLWSEYEWECVELSMRYMYQVYGISPYSSPGGKDVVGNYSGSTLSPVTNNGTSLPSPGDIISEAATGSNPYGHTAVVTGVNVTGGSGTVTIMQQNASSSGIGSITVIGGILKSNVSGWLHNPNAGVSVSDGEYIKSASTGEVYIVAGGAAIGLPTWDSVGGTKTVGATLTQTQIDAMGSIPKDGTFVEAYNSPTVYEMAGGAAFGVPSSASVNDSIGTIDEIPAGTSFQQYPNNQSYVQEYDSTTVNEVVGNAPVVVPSWSSVGDGTAQHVAMIPDGGLNQLASHPADGTFVEDYGSQTVSIMAGNAAFGIPTPSALGGNIGAPVVIPAGTTFPSQPADGAYVQPYGSGTVYLAAGGAALPLSNWNAVGGQHNVAQIPDGGLGQFLAEPRDGTFVAEYGSPAVFEMAGGAAIPLPNWNSVGGEELTTMIPDGDAAGMPTTPANGTFVESYGSPTVEEIVGGAQLPLASWNQVGGSQSVEQVPAGTTFASLPADGTYIEEYDSSTVAVTAGGAALDITSWPAVGGPEPVTTIPSGAIASDLLAYPQNGTYVKGYGTGDEFEAMNGSVTQVTTSPLPAATTVDDWAIVNQLGGTE